MTPFKKNITKSIDNLNRICKTILSVYDNKMLSDNVLNQSGSDLTFNNTVAGGKFDWEIQGKCEQDTSWEKYVGGIPSPNPNFPQDIRVVTGDNDVVVQNKNLLYLDDVTETIIPQALVNMKIVNGIMYLNGTATATIGHENAFWKNNVSLKIKAGTYYYKNFENMSIVIRNATTNNLITTTDTNGSFTLSQDTECFFGIRIISGTSFSNKSIQYYLSKSNETEYIIPLQQSTTLHLGTEYLGGIDTYDDEIVGKTDEWKIKRNVGKVTLNGSETFGTRTNKNNVKQISCNVSSQISNVIEGQSSQQLCNYAKYFYATYNFGEIGQFLLSSGSTVYIGVDDSETETTFANKLQNNNLVIYAPISQPTEETITDTTLINNLNNMYNLMGYDGQTNISIVPAVGNATPNLKVTAFVTEKEV